MKNYILFSLIIFAFVGKSIAQQEISLNRQLYLNQAKNSSTFHTDIWKQLQDKHSIRLQPATLFSSSFKMNGNIYFRLDSTITYQYPSPTDSALFYKTIYEYDKTNNITTSIFYNSNPLSNTWMPEVKFENITSGNDMYNAYYTWDTQQKTWICQSKYERRFDTEGRDLLVLDYKLKNWSGNEEGYRQEFKYDDDGNQILMSYHIWNIEKKAWIPERKEEKEFDSNGNITLKVDYSWNYESNNWQIQRKEKTEHELNDLGKLEYSYTDVWNFDKQAWSKWTKQLFSYNDLGLLVSESTSIWNTTSNAWDLSSKKEYSYDEYGNAILELAFNRDSRTAAWIAYEKKEYQFDSSGNETFFAMYMWNSEINDWAGFNKYEQQFNSSGLVTVASFYAWNTATKNWVNTNKFEYTFNTVGENTLSIAYNWNESKNSWVATSKTEQEFDNSQNITLNASYTWNEQNQQWQVSQKTKYELSYDNDGNILINAIYNWDLASSAFTLQYKDFNYYTKTDGTASIQNTSLNKKIKIFPNPTSDFVSIIGANEAQLKMFDLSGNCCLVVDNVSSLVNISHLTKGIYLLKIFEGNTIYTQKIVKL